MAASQTQLVIGWRLGDCMAEPDFAALRVFSSLLGGSTMSKLFVNVREKLSLCYFVYSVCDTHKGVMFACAGTESADAEKARDEILAQLEAIARGEISDEELDAARADASSSLRQALDSLAATEAFFLSAATEGLDVTPLELAELAQGVTKQQLAEIARGCECDLIYTLTGIGAENDDEDGDGASPEDDDGENAEV